MTRQLAAAWFRNTTVSEWGYTLRRPSHAAQEVFTLFNIANVKSPLVLEKAAGHCNCTPIVLESRIT